MLGSHDALAPGDSQVSSVMSPPSVVQSWHLQEAPDKDLRAKDRSAKAMSEWNSRVREERREDLYQWVSFVGI